MRGLRTQKHRPVLRRVRAPVLQVGDDPLPDIDRQRQPINPVAFAAHGDLAAAPVDVVQAQRGDLTDPQAQAQQHRQDRQIPAAGRGALVATGQQRPHLLVVQRHGQAGQRPPGRRGHRRGQATGR